MLGRSDVVLDAISNQAKCRVHNVQLWIHAQCRGKEQFTIRAVAIEKVAIVEIPIGAGVGDWFRGLV